MVRALAVAGVLASAFLSAQAAGSVQNSEGWEAARLIDRHLVDLAINREANVAQAKRELAEMVDRHLLERAIKHEEVVQARRDHVAGTRRSLSNHRTRSGTRDLSERAAKAATPAAIKAALVEANAELKKQNAALAKIAAASQGGKVKREPTLDPVVTIIKTVQGVVQKVTGIFANIPIGQKRAAGVDEFSPELTQYVQNTVDIFSNLRQIQAKRPELKDATFSSSNAIANNVKQQVSSIHGGYGDVPVLNDIAKLLLGSVTNVGSLVHGLGVDKLLGSVLQLGRDNGSAN